MAVRPISTQTKCSPCVEVIPVFGIRVRLSMSDDVYFFPVRPQCTPSRGRSGVLVYGRSKRTRGSRGG